MDIAYAIIGLKAAYPYVRMSAVFNSIKLSHPIEDLEKITFGDFFKSCENWGFEVNLIPWDLPFYVNINLSYHKFVFDNFDTDILIKKIQENKVPGRNFKEARSIIDSEGLYSKSENQFR